MSVAVTIEASARRRPGRPSKAAPFRDFLKRTLVARPEMQTFELLEFAKAEGFAGGKSALYAMVASLRQQMPVPTAAAARVQARAQKQAARARRRADRAAQREARAAEARERGRARGEARQRRQAAREAAHEERLAARGKLPLEVFHPLADDEASTRMRVLARKWLDSRETTHKTNGDDRCRWRVNLAPSFGDLEPSEVDQTKLRAFIEEKLAAGLISTTVRNCMALLSSLFTDLIEQGLATRNPVQGLSRAVKRLYRRAHDPRTTPFLDRVEDVRRLIGALTEPMRTLYCVGVMAGLRPGEIVALEWADFRSDLRMLHLQRRYRQGRIDVPKSGKGRTIPLAGSLTEVLGRWRDATGGGGLVFKPEGNGRCIDLQLWRLRTAWRAGLERAGLPYITFYCASRHTYASQWVMAGQPIEKLSKLLGHSSVMVTEIYAHLKPESMTVPDVISFGQRVEDPKVAVADGRAA